MKILFQTPTSTPTASQPIPPFTDVTHRHIPSALGGKVDLGDERDISLHGNAGMGALLPFSPQGLQSPSEVKVISED